MNNTVPNDTIRTPNQTLYVNNLNEKIKPEEQKINLYFLFSQFGEILDIVTKKSDKMRGQAFVVFRDITAATTALKELQGYNLFEKNIRINFAREKSEAVAKFEGTFVPKIRKEADAEDDAPKKKIKGEGKATNVAAQQQAKNQKPQKNVGVPNHILFVENLPQKCTEEMLVPLFKEFPGFKEIRLIPSKSVAFVEYVDELQAGIAMTGLQGFNLTEENALALSYAKQ